MASSTTKKSKSKSPSARPKANSVSTKIAKKSAQSIPARRPPRASNGSRQLAPPRRRFRRMPKRFRPQHESLPGAFRLLWRSLGVLKRHWKLFLGITLMYGALNIILVRGLGGGTNLTTLKSTLDQTLHGRGGKLSTGFTVFVYLLGGSGSAAGGQSSGAYQTVLVIIVSLALIWSLRQVYAQVRIRVRDGFYRGMYPFIPFILVLLIIGLQLLPLLLGGTLYATVISKGIAVQVFEKLLWALMFFLLALASLYMVCSSIFALYIVTLPDMTPLKALRSARELVRYRRFTILRKLLFLPLGLLILAALVMIPLIIWLTPAAAWIYFGLSMFGLAIVHSYLYALYRELLQ